MDTSRFKRRETENSPLTQNDAEGTPASPPRVSSWPTRIVSDDIRPARQKPLRRVPAAPTPIKVQAPIARPVAAPEPAPAVPSVPIDMELPGELSPARQLLLRVRGNSRRVRRIVFRTTAVALILLMVTGGALFSQGIFRLHKVFKGGTASVAALRANVAPALLKGEGDGRVNVLLLGRGGGTHEAPDLTDTMMVASIDPVNHTAVLLSVPRDLWVSIPNAGAMKINAAFETGEFKYLGKVAPGTNDQKAIQAGLELADTTVESVLGITINYNALVDFSAFKQAVDTLGGVSVNVPTDLVDPTMAWENKNNPVLAKAGLQVFDGTHALIYVRSRETTSDFARGERQRSVMLALKEKATTLGTLSNPVKISGLLSAFGNNVQTDFSISDASRFASIIKDVDNSKVSSVSLNGHDGGTDSQVTTAAMNGQSVVEPKLGIFNYSGIQTFVRTVLKDGYIAKENANLEVLNGTTVPGLASKKAADLKTYGYNIVATGNAPTQGYAQTVLVDLSGGKFKYTQNYLEQRYNVKAVSTLPDATIKPNGADFVIIVGSDETTSSQN